MTDLQTGDLMTHVMIFLSGSTALGIVAHAVNTFPTPKNVYGQWFIGVIQFLVGQRIAAKNTLQGMDSTITASPAVKGTGNGTVAPPPAPGEQKGN